MRMPLGALVLAVCLAPGTMAQTSVGDESLAQAKAHYEQGQAHFDHAEYDAAIAEFTRANELAPAPLMKYNLAQAYRLKGECGKALGYYREYLAAGPPASDRQLVESLAAEMEACVARAATTPKTAPAPAAVGPAAQPRATTPVMRAPVVVNEPPMAKAKPASRAVKLASWVLLGVGAVGLGGGAYSSWQVHAAERDVAASCADGCSWADEAARDQDGRNAEARQLVFYGVGAAALVGGTILYYLGTGEEAPRVSALPLPGGAAGMATWKW